MGCSSLFYGYVSAPQSSLRVLSKELLLCSFCLKSLALLQSSAWKLFPPIPLRKRFPYARILSFIYKATHSLWNILFPFFLHARGYGKSIMCGSLGDFPKDAVVSCLVSDQIPFNLLSICSRMCLNRDLPTFYMQPEFFLQTNHMQPRFLLKVVICPFSICNPDSFQVSLFGRDLLSLMASSLMQSKNKVEIRNHVIGNRIK